jgi:2-oxoglutarate ferredoxin oxidoreductase subunit delta
MDNERGARVRRGELVIDEESCLGCGYCVLACKPGCLDLTGGKISSSGFPLPVLVRPEDCTACGGCAVMCPPLAIEVYAVTFSTGAKGRLTGG